MTDQPDPDSAKTPGGEPPIPVDERENVGTVRPEDYPDAQGTEATGQGIQSPPGLDDEKDFERRNPGR